MTKALLLPVLALITMLNFSGNTSTTSTAGTKQVSASKPLCGPWLTFINNTSYTITNIQVSNSSAGTANFSNPTFPFTYQPGYGGWYAVKVTTSSGGQGGIVSAYLDNNLIACRIFISPQVWALNFQTSCSPYDVIISEDTDCP